MKYLLDTSAISRLFQNNIKVAELINSLNPQEIYVSAVTTGEIYYGVFQSSWGSRRKNTFLKNLDEFISNVKCIDFGVKESEIFGKLKTKLNKNGQKVADLDLQIAATAIYNSMILVSADSDFERVSGLKLIKV